MKLIKKINDYVNTLDGNDKNVHILKRELHQHIHNLLTSKDDSIQEITLLQLGVSPDTINLIIMSLQNGSPKIRKILYTKLLDFDLKTTQLQHDSLLQLLKILIDDISKDAGTGALQLLESLILTSSSKVPSINQNVDFRLMHILDKLVINAKFIPPATNLVIKELMMLGITKYRTREEAIEEGLTAWTYLKQCCKLWDAQQAENLDYDAILKSLMLLRILLSYFSLKKEFKQEYDNLSVQLPSYRYLRKLLKTCKQQGFFLIIEYIAYLATHSVMKNKKASRKSKEHDMNSSTESKKLLETISKFILDPKQFLAWDRSLNKEFGLPLTIQSLPSLGMKNKAEEINYTFTYPDVCKLIYSPLELESPYCLIEPMLRSYMHLYTNNMDTIASEERVEPFAHFWGILNRRWKKIDPEGEWSQSHNGSLYEQYVTYKNQYKVKNKQYKELKEMKNAEKANPGMYESLIC